MILGPTTKRSREVNLESFKRLLAHLDPDPIRAWERYDTLQRKLAMFFHHTHSFDAEELAEDTLERVGKTLESGEVESVVEFAFGVARNVRKEAHRRSSARIYVSDLDGNKVFAGEERISAEDTIIGEIDLERGRKCFLVCLRRLSPDDYRLILNYYPPDGDNLEKHRQTLAQTAGMKIGALRTRMARLREKLMTCFMNCRAASSTQPGGRLHG
jgi:RNA polymerase sigma factor (sigma-70 family)